MRRNKGARWITLSPSHNAPLTAAFAARSIAANIAKLPELLKKT